MTGGALVGWAVSALYDHTARPMALAVAALAVAALLVHVTFLLGSRVDAVWRAWHERVHARNPRLCRVRRP